jgi:CIC family chloride channel protein
VQKPNPAHAANISNRFTEWLDRIEASGQLVLSITAVIVGAGTGLGAVAFIWMLGEVGLFTTWARGILGSAAGLLVVMVVAGFVVGWIIDRFAREAKGHGVPEVMEAMVLRGGRIRPRVSVAKVLASSITIGTGGSAGREGPIVQVGSALGSTFGQFLRFSNERLRTLVACGAAAGIAATFNAPIAGAIFALEVILGNFTVRYFGAVVISSVSASIMAQAFLGNRPAFEVPAYPLNNPAELLVYVLLGILSAFLAVAFIRVLYSAEEISDRWRVPLPLKTALGMGLTAGVGLLLAGEPVLGPGLHLIGQAISTDFQFSIGLMVAMLGLKLLATVFTLGTGNSGGVFAPSLFMGALLGGIVGQIGNTLWPGVMIHPGAYALVGMAAAFAGAARAPMTAILIVFEMSGDYRLILPLMLATVISTVIAELLFRESIYTLKLKLKGITLQRGRVVDVLQGVQVSEVLSKADTVRATASLDEAEQKLNKLGRRSLPILDGKDQLVGVIALADISRAADNGLDKITKVLQVATPRESLRVAFPDETVGEALARMSSRGLGLLPVVSRENHNHLVGQVRRDDLLRAYDLALNRRTEIEHRSEKLRAQDGENATFLEIQLKARGWAVKKTLAEIAKRLPVGCVIVSVKRDDHVLIPRGDTRFEPGDKVLAFVNRQDIEALRVALG